MSEPQPALSRRQAAAFAFLLRCAYLKRQRQEFYASRETCSWCGTLMATPESTDDIARTIDHIRPRSVGGPINNRDNWKLSCRKCNGARAITGHCIGALACARAVLGETANVKEIAGWWRAGGKVPEVVVTRKTHAASRLRAEMQGLSFTVSITPATHVLYEGTAAFRALLHPLSSTSRKRAVRCRKIVDMTEVALFYDAVWFLNGKLLILRDDLFVMSQRWLLMAAQQIDAVTGEPGPPE